MTPMQLAKPTPSLTDDSRDPSSFFPRLIFRSVAADTTVACPRKPISWATFHRVNARQIPGWVPTGSSPPPLQILMIGLSCHPVSLDRLCEHVEKRLCDFGQLEPSQFPLTRRDVIRGGKNCGIYFCLHGPRSVKLTAIYDAIKKTIIYYGADGNRRHSELLGN